MLNGLWIGILLGFAALTDYTVQNNHIPKINWKPDPIIKERIIYYDIIEVGEDGIRSFTKDSIVYYDEVKLLKNRSSAER